MGDTTNGPRNGEEQCGTNSLIREALALPEIPIEAVEAYELGIEQMTAVVDEAVFGTPGFSSLCGPLPLQRFRDNHRHHAAFMAVVFRYRAYRTLATVLPWVYRSYHKHGVSLEYFRLELAVWENTVQDALDDRLNQEILAVYRWLRETHNTVCGLLDEPSPFAPLPELTAWAGTTEALANRLLQGEWREGLELLDEANRPGGMVECFDFPLRNAMYRIGDRWEQGEISVAREHLATASVARMLSSITDPSVQTGERKGTAVVTAAANEHHEMGAWLVADALEEAGWKVRFLGANTPNEELVELLDEDCPDILAISVSLFLNLPWAERAIRAARLLPNAQRLRVMVGGLALQTEPEIGCRIGADGTGASCKEAVKLADSWWKDGARGT